MKIENKILDVIYNTIDDINTELTQKMEKSFDTDIIGGGSILDSLGVFTFVTNLENKLEEKFNQHISLINDDFLNGSTEHLENVKQLQKYLMQILKD